jgi:hypothetical protein
MKNITRDGPMGLQIVIINIHPQKRSLREAAKIIKKH